MNNGLNLFFRDINTPLLDDHQDVLIEIKKNNEKDSQYKQNMMTLLDMGFSKRMIDLIFSLYSINSLEQAIYYMSQENNIWQHNYLKSEDDDNCLICNDDTDHIDYQKKSKKRKFTIESDESLKVKKFMEIVDKDDDLNEKRSLEDSHLITCEVCMGEYGDDEFLSLDCLHLFCSYCWQNYTENLISEGKVFDLKCMQKDCDERIPQEFLEEILNQEYLSKLKLFKKNKTVLKNKNCKFCPKVNCTGSAERIDKNVKNVECEYGHRFCWGCLKDWHETKTCTELIDEDFDKWKIGKKLKKCPSCKFWTEKNEGCNHMTCQGCGHQWCWLCMGKYFQGHYGPFGPCEGLQYAENANLRSPFNRKMRMILLITRNVCFVILMVLAFIIFGVSLLAIIQYKRYKFRLDNRFAEVLKFITLWIFGMVFQPFALSVVISIILALILIALIFLPITLFVIFKYAYHAI